MCDCHIIHLIAIQGLLYQPRAQGFMKYIGQQSPAPLLESELVRSWLQQWAPLRQRLDSDCYSWKGWSCISSQNHRQPPKDGGDGLVHNLLLLKCFIEWHKWAWNNTWSSKILASMLGLMIVMYAAICSNVTVKKWVLTGLGGIWVMTLTALAIQSCTWQSHLTHCFIFIFLSKLAMA